MEHKDSADGTQNGISIQPGDEYSWMEAGNDMLMKWLKDQHKGFEDFFANKPERHALQANILNRLKAASVIGEMKANSAGLFFLHRKAGSNHFTLMFLPWGAEQPGLVFDPRLGDEHSQVDISYFFPSASSRFVILGLTSFGSEISCLKVYSRETGAFIGGEIDLTQYPEAEFLPDETGFLYVRHDGMNSPDPSLHLLHSTVRFRRLTEEGPGIIVAGEAVRADRPFEKDDFYEPKVLANPSCVVLACYKGTSSPYRFYCKNTEELENNDKPWRLILDVDECVRRFAYSQDSLFVINASPEGGNQVERLKVSSGSKERQLIRKADDINLSGISVGSQQLFLWGREGLDQVFLSLSLNGGTEERQNMAIGYVIEHAIGSSDVHHCILRLASPFLPTSFQTYDPHTSELKTIQGLASDEPEADVEIELHWAISYDDTHVPYMIVKKRGTKLEQDTPAFVYSYATYGFSYFPGYDRFSKEWFEAGGVRVYCFARGGGELGDSWHRAGQKEKKKNSFLDTVACVEDLIQKGFTSPRRLAFLGGSAGGIIAGKLAAERPELFAVIISDVGVLNISRCQITATGAANVPEYGDMNVPGEREALLKLDAYLSLSKGKTPSIFMACHGFHDSRVPVWMSSKFVARLKDCSDGQSTILMRTDFDTGHGLTVSTGSSKASLWADIYALMFFAMGVKPPLSSNPEKDVLSNQTSATT